MESRKTAKKAHRRWYDKNKKLSRSEKTRNIPIIAMVPSEPPDMVEKLSADYDMGNQCETGKCHVLHYPFSFAELIEKIGIVLGTV